MAIALALGAGCAAGSSGAAPGSADSDSVADDCLVRFGSSDVGRLLDRARRFVGRFGLRFRALVRGRSAHRLRADTRRADFFRRRRFRTAAGERANCEQRGAMPGDRTFHASKLQVREVDPSRSEYRRGRESPSLLSVRGIACEFKKFVAARWLLAEAVLGLSLAHLVFCPGESAGERHTGTRPDLPSRCVIPLTLSPSAALCRAGMC